MDQHLPHVDLNLLLHLRIAIILWLSKRKETVEAMEREADKLKEYGKKISTVKLAGASISTASSVAAGVLGIATIFMTGGLAAPLAAAGVVAGVAGVGGAVTSLGAEVMKLINSSEREINAKWKDEQNEYLTVIENLGRMMIIILRNNNVQVDDIQYAVGQMVRFIVKVGTTGRFMEICVAETATTAAATKAAQYVMAKNTTEKTLAEATKVSTRAAKTATQNSTVGSTLYKVFPGTVDCITSTAGKKAAEEAMEIGVEAGTKALTEGAKNAAAPAAKQISSEVAQECLEGGAKALGQGAGTIGKLLTLSVPLVNFGFAAWDARDAYKAYQSLHDGLEEERKLRDKIRDLKNEANTIVRVHYNPFAQNQQQPTIEIPFPD